MEITELLQINVKINDKAAMERLTPDMILSYVSKRPRYSPDRVGSAIKDAKYEGWISRDSQEQLVFIVVLLDRTLRDYALRTHEALTVIASAEERSELAVYVDILEGNGGGR